MQPMLASFGVSVIALSRDTVKEAAAQIARDGLRFPLLSDPELKVIEAFGLVHTKALAFKSWTLFGVPLGVPTGYEAMAIPTTFLIDESGIVRWIDQADDYRIRGDETRILEATKNAFSSPHAHDPARPER